MASRIIYAIAAIVLVSGIQFLAGVSGDPVLVVIAGALLCLVPHGLWMFLESQADSNLDLYLPGIAAITGIFIGGMVRWMFQPDGAFGADLLAVGLGAVGSGIITMLRIRQRSQRCQRCCGYLAGDYQHCPRCGKAFCGLPSCWDIEYHRCFDCELLGRPLLPLDDDDWWIDRTGPRLKNGTCFKCRQDAKECDLRNCKVCPRAMCIQCWDFENGRCVRCHWRMPGLPEALQAYLPADEASIK